MKIIHSYDEIKTLISACGIRCAEAEFKKSAGIHTPYLCWFRSKESPVRADGVTAYTCISMAIELYTDKGDTETEAALEGWFAQNGIIADKTERAFVEGEGYYESVYEFELILL